MAVGYGCCSLLNKYRKLALIERIVGRLTLLLFLVALANLITARLLIRFPRTSFC